MILTHPTIEQEIDKGIRYKQLKSIFKSDDFSSNEKQLLFHILSGKEAASLSVELQMDKKEIYRTYSNLKAKLKTRVSSKPKYLLIYSTGKTFTMKTKKELCEQTGFCIDTLNQYLSIGKLKHKNFTIVIN
jgi:helix-turn-helix protein